MTLRGFGQFLFSAALTAVVVVACSDGPAQAPEGTPLTHQRAGLDCQNDAQCGLDRCELDRFPGGACVGTCDSSGACPHPDGGVEQICLGAPGTGGCLRGCESDGGCVRAGWICQDSMGGRVCLPNCRTAPHLCAGDDGGAVCNTTNGLCQAPLPPDAGDYGFCGVSSSCASGAECLAVIGQGGDGGFCTGECDLADGGGCAAPGACVVRETLLDGGLAGRCAVACDAGPDCAPGLDCRGVPGGTEADGGPKTLGLCTP